MFRHTYGGSGEDDARLSVEMEKRNVFTDGEENEFAVSIRKWDEELAGILFWFKNIRIRNSVDVSHNQSHPSARAITQ